MALSEEQARWVLDNPSFKVVATKPADTSEGPGWRTDKMTPGLKALDPKEGVLLGNPSAPAVRGVDGWVYDLRWLTLSKSALKAWLKTQREWMEGF